MNTTVDEKSLETMISDHGDDLCHYGVANQKWGQRKYQYMDGRLTPLGRLHYGIGFKNIGQVEAARRAKAKVEKEKAEAKERKRAEDVDRVTRTGSAEEIYKMRESMTDAELTRAVQRMNATKQLEQALAQSANVKLSKVSEPKKMSFFEKQKDKKAEKEAKEAAEKAEKEKKAQEAINKGLQVLETATRVTNTVAGAYESYNKMASMINEVGGTSLPTFSSQPWNKKNPSKNEQIIKTGDASKILESSTGMSNEELSNAAKRLTSLKVIKGHVSDGGSSKATDTEPQAEKKAETKQSSSTDSDKAYQSLMSMLDSDFGSLNGSSGSSVSNSKPSSMPKTDSDKAYKEVMSMMESWSGQKVPDDPFSVLEDIMKHFDMNGGETMESWTINRDENVICHYGTKGQKWGVRRYQNSDGSLTPAGRERYFKKRSEYGLDVQDRSQLTRKQQKMQERASSEYLMAKKRNPNIDKSDKEIRKYAEDVYKTTASIERGHTFLATAIAAVGGTLISGGNPVGGAVSAAATLTANTPRAILRGRRTADYATTLAVGKEVTDNFIKDVSVYLTTIPAEKSNR